MVGIFPDDEKKLGVVVSVDTQTAVVEAVDETVLSDVQVNHLVSIESQNLGERYIGLVERVIRKEITNDPDEPGTGVGVSSYNAIKMILVGTYLSQVGTLKNVFRRSLSSVPTTSAQCFQMKSSVLKAFMSCVGASNSKTSALSLGTYSVDSDSEATIDGNKFFQRHALIVGSTGSGKSWTVAKILEEAANLKSTTAILFDIHGEYSTLTSPGFIHYKIAGPSDSYSATDNALFLPYYFLSYEEMISLMLDRSDSNAPNQAMMFSKNVLELKKEFCISNKKEDIENQITIDSPVPYSLKDLMAKLNAADVEMVPGANNREKQGTYNGKLTRFIQRLEAKAQDKRLNFLFNDSPSLLDFSYFPSFCGKLINPAVDGVGCVRIIDFSEVPSDILPLITSLVSRLVFTVQQWSLPDKRVPVALFCEEAHLYIPANANESTDDVSLNTFKRIAKEGRKYGTALVVISQRPSEVNTTVLSQLGNIVAMRLTSTVDKNVVSALLPDSLGGFGDMLPILDVGEAVVIGDSALLPSRIKVAPPKQHPQSATIDFWDVWSKDAKDYDVYDATNALIKQSK